MTEPDPKRSLTIGGTNGRYGIAKQSLAHDAGYSCIWLSRPVASWIDLPPWYGAENSDVVRVTDKQSFTVQLIPANASPARH